MTHHCCVAQYSLNDNIEGIEVVSDDEDNAKVYKVSSVKKAISSIHKEIHRITEHMEEFNSMTPSSMYDYDIVYTFDYLITLCCVARDILHKYSKQSED